jgi:hypothetical protein
MGAAVLVVVAAAVGLSLGLTGGGGSKPLTHADFARLWQGTRLGQQMQAVLARWPRNPYQHYTDGTKNDCYEWADAPDPHRTDMPQNLYNLCFKNGVLRTKDLL